MSEHNDEKMKALYDAGPDTFLLGGDKGDSMAEDIVLSPPLFCAGRKCSVVPSKIDLQAPVGPWLDAGWTCLVHKGPDENSFAMRWLCPRCSDGIRSDKQ